MGSLMSLCEENYLLVSRIVPHLRSRKGTLVSRLSGGVDLHLSIEEQTRYTTVFRLTYVFPASEGLDPGLGSDPNALLRAYHDARQVEVLDLRQTALPKHADYQHPALDAKWRVNLFLSKWLSYCLQQGHRFGASGAEARVAQGDDLAVHL